MAIKILVIDDDPVTRRLLSRNLEKLSYVVIQSANGRHGWETLWQNQDIKLVITDMMMPDMDGRELIQIIRSHHVFVYLPIIIISGIVSVDEVRDVVRLGNCGFCGKPLDMNRLLELIAEALSSDFQVVGPQT